MMLDACNEGETLAVGDERARRVWYREFRAMTTDEILGTAARRAAEDPGGQRWRPGFVPFASDPDGSLLVVAGSAASTDCETRAGEEAVNAADAGTVHEWDEAEGLGEELGGSFDDFLSAYREYLCGGPSVVEGRGTLAARNAEWIADVGVVECMVSGEALGGRGE
jgi:hypothetical protein